MRILTICQYYYPEQFLINEICEELAKRGNEVTVITGVPNYPKGVVFEGYENGKRSDEIVNGVHVIRCNIRPRKQGKLNLLLNYFSYMVKATREVKKHKGEFDVVYLYQMTPIMQAYPAIRYARRNNIKIVCYCLDLAPASGEDIVGNIKPFFAIYRWFSKWAYQHCDMIAVSSKDFIDYLHTVHDIPNSKMTYLPQHAPEGLLGEDLIKTESDGIVDFMFAGNIGFGSRLDFLIMAAERIINQGYKLRVNIVGDGSDKARLQSFVEQRNLQKNVLFFDAVPMSKMRNVYKKADVLVVSLRKGQLTVPSKVQAYMATGKPILGMADGSAKKLIQEVGCGKCVAAEDVEGMSEIMKEFIVDQSSFAVCGVNGKKYFEENFRLSTYISRIYRLLHEMAER